MIWGTICDDYWNDRAAQVVCRTLGFLRGISYEKAYYGEGTGPIHLDDVMCSGSEGAIMECDHRKPIGRHNCRHREDAGVACIN